MINHSREEKLTFVWAIFISAIFSLSFYVNNKSLETIKTADVSVEQGESELSNREIIIDYIKSVNSNVSSKVAQNLSDAIIIQKRKYGIPIPLQLGLITVESRFDQYALSSAGALGFWQVVPSWHTDKVKVMLRNDEIVSKNLYDPLTNSTLGAKILSDCMKSNRHNIERSLLCYNGSQHDRRREYAKRVLEATYKAKNFIEKQKSI